MIQVDSILLETVTDLSGVQQIVYTVAASLVLALLATAAGVPRYFLRQVRRMLGERRFDSRTRALCERVIAVGQREGFQLSDIYVPLDLVPSELANLPEGRAAWSMWRRSFVLLGGPGAGKSTWVKHLAANWGLGRSFFLRLRDLPADKDIVEVVTAAASNARIPDPSKWVQSQFTNRKSLVVLDGLDEVRSVDWDLICNRINNFAKTYASQGNGLTLVVTCRKEAYRSVPLTIPDVREVRPLTDQQIARFAKRWPPGYPPGKNEDTFLRDLQGSKRVLEVARSPLMLVGALMQYTESNLGIPDERKDYLERISKWLIEDWAKAQGHPADEWRKAYEPVLTALAFDMHCREVAEIPRDEGVRVIRETLPKVGLDGGKTDQFIERLASKTGILVRDTPGHLVFAQFSLQEYFASRALAARYSPDDLVKLNPEWWREAILLGVAQKPEPSEFFTALFDWDPALGIAAVAEYPTPPLVFQGTAITAALAAIDGGDVNVSDSVITLARKVEGKHERNLIDGLEERLQSPTDSVSVEAGRVLALAGTDAANVALGNNSGGWERSLSRVGYFSSSFEDLLVSWIRGSNEVRATAAANAILERLSDDRRDELIEALDDLPSQRAVAVAHGIIDSLTDRRPLWSVNRDVLRVACYCAPHMRQESTAGSHGQSLEQPSRMIALVAASLQEARGSTPTESLRTMFRAASWAIARRRLLWAGASALILASLGLPDLAAEATLVTGGALGLATTFLGRYYVPWMPIASEANLERPLSFVAGASISVALLGGSIQGMSPGHPAAVVVASLVFGMMAVIGGRRLPEDVGKSSGAGLRYLARFLRGWVIAVPLLGMVSMAFPVLGGRATAIAGLLAVVVIAVLVFVTRGAARHVARARDRVFKLDGAMMWLAP